jgi:hypothetical protein
MALGYLQFRSERDMGDWLDECLAGFTNNGEGHGVPQIHDVLLPRLASDLKWAHRLHPDHSDHFELDWCREYRIDGASAGGRGSAPCDFLIQGVAVDEGAGRIYSVEIIVELKNRPAKGRDFGQLSRYMRAYLALEEGYYPTKPTHVLGAVLADGCETEARTLAEMVNGVALVDLELYDQQIIALAWNSYGAGDLSDSHDWRFDPRHGEVISIEGGA